MDVTPRSESQDNGRNRGAFGSARGVLWQPHMRITHLLAELLELEEIDCVFTVPGGTAVPLLQALRGRAVRVVVAKDEAGAAFAADGYAWATGKPGVVIGIGGPGATNALTGLCCSRAQNNPVVLLSGEVGSASMGRGAVQDGSELGLDVLAMSRPATALSVSASNTAKAAHALREAFRRAIHERCPVHVSLPLDVQTAELADRPRLTRAYRAERARALDLDRSALLRAAHLLQKAERPVLLVGNGARDAAAPLLELAEKLRCPVATTCNAKGVFPEQHPLSIGVFSFGSGPLARAVLTAPPDVLCVVGTRLGEFSSMNYSANLVPSRALIHIDRDPSRIGVSYGALAVVGDAGAALSELCAAIAPEPARSAPWCSDLMSQSSRFDDPAALASDAVPLRPERVMAEIQAALPDDARVVADIGTSCLFVAHCLRLSPRQRSYIPMAWSCMAHPLAASLGVRLGSQRPTLCVTGDAAFLAKGLELHAAVEAKIGGFVWVVLSNRGHGLVRFGTAKLLGADHGVEAGDFRAGVDAAQIARGVGAEGIVIERPEQLSAALARALAAPGPVLLDVRVDPNAEPPMADRIQGLLNASRSAPKEAS